MRHNCQSQDVVVLGKLHRSHGNRSRPRLKQQRPFPDAKSAMAWQRWEVVDF